VNRNATVKEFAAEIQVGIKYAYGMVKSAEFLKHSISKDISVRKDKKNAYWRVDMLLYYACREKGII
jgi:hypothetical protein